MNDQPPPFIDNTKWLLKEVPGWNPWLLAGISAGVVILLALIGYWLYRKKKLSLPFFAPPTPGEIALKALGEIDPLLSEDRAHEFVVRLSEILRLYIEGQFGLRALHLSTEEFLLEARDRENLLPEQQALLKNFLFQCDLVKFARREMVLEQMTALLQSAREFVETTSARPSSPEPKKS